MMGGSSKALFTRVVRRLSTELLRIRNVKLVEEVDRDLKERIYKAKKHPGRTALSLVTLSDRLKAAGEVVLHKYECDKSGARKEAVEFFHYLNDRKPPVEDGQLKQKAIELEKELVASLQNRTVDLDEKKKEEMILKRLRQTTYHWEPIDYNVHRGMLYILARAAPDYAVLTQIFTEVKKREPEFVPKAIMDFGSGIGTVLWAAHGVWGGDITEYFAVDTSAEMNDIARLLTQDGRESRASFLKGIFFRQFLPASHTLRYDVVVSAYSLMELPNRTSRLHTLDNLWRKTDRFLVLVENGTNAGYRLIMEARAYIIRQASHSGSASMTNVFAPCSHELRCPRLRDDIPCNFEVGYNPMFEMGTGTTHGGKLITRFSYVVLEKKSRVAAVEEEDGRSYGGREWPRIISKVLPRPRHVVCRTCNSDGRLKEVVITAAKHGKELYKCARGSRLGDRLPVTMKDDDERDYDRENEDEGDYEDEVVGHREDETDEPPKMR